MFKSIKFFCFVVSYSDECLLVNCDYLFVVDSDARIINPNTLRNLIETNRLVNFNLKNLILFDIFLAQSDQS